MVQWLGLSVNPLVANVSVCLESEGGGVTNAVLAHTTSLLQDVQVS